MHRLRLVSATLPDGLHFNGSGSARLARGRRQTERLRANDTRHGANVCERATAPRPPPTTQDQRASAVAAAIARAQQRRGTCSAMNPAKRRAIYETLRALNPNPTTELLYTTPFELLVAVVLSAQATDKGVNAATRALFRDRQHSASAAQAR